MSYTPISSTPCIPSVFPPYEGSFVARVSSKGYLKLPKEILAQSMKRFNESLHGRQITDVQDLTLLLGHIPTWYVGGIENSPTLLSCLDVGCGNHLNSRNAPYFNKVDLTKNLELNLNQLPQLIYARNVRLIAHADYFSISLIQCCRV